MKQCKTCKKKKDVAEFYKTNYAGSLNTECKECYKKRQHEKVKQVRKERNMFI